MRFAIFLYSVLIFLAYSGSPEEMSRDAAVQFCQGFRRDAAQSCLQTIAARRQAPSICQLIPGKGRLDCAFDGSCHIKKSDQCLEFVAAYSENPSVCQQIHDRKIKSACQINLVIQRKNIELCQHIKSSTESDRCIEDVAEALKDDKPCSVIKKKHQKEFCLAKTSNTITGCERLKINDLKRECLFRLVSSVDSLKAPNLCNMIPHTDPEGLAVQDQCFSKVGKGSLDSSYCMRISDNSFERASCLKFVANMTQNPQPCLKMKNPDDRRMCLQSVAIRAANPKICEQIWEEPHPLDPIFPPTFKDACIELVAWQKKDKEICNRISDLKWKIHCNEGVLNPSSWHREEDLRNAALATAIGQERKQCPAKDLACRDNLANRQAHAAADEKYCLEIMPSLDRNRCIIEVRAEIAAKDKKVILSAIQITDTPEEISEADNKMAARRELEACKLFAEPSTRQVCVRSALESYSTIVDCSILSDEVEMRNCQLGLEEKKRCDLEGPFCYFLSAMERKDFRLCGQFSYFLGFGPPSSKRDLQFECFIKVAALTRDPKICNLINWEYSAEIGVVELRDKCLEQVKKIQ